MTDTSARDAYVAACVARWQHSDAGQPVDGVAGLHGFVGSEVDRRLRLIVTDDRALPRLTALCRTSWPAAITVLTDAARCIALLVSDPSWSSTQLTAMIRRDLTLVPAPGLTTKLQVRPIRRVDADPVAGVSLTDAVAAVVAADPGEEPEALAALLRSLPGPVKLFAAVDDSGVVRATSGWQRDGTHAHVILVDTDRGWRGRGIGAAMTSFALRAAQTDGARLSTLESSPAGRSVYLRVGFEVVSDMMRFRRAR